MNGLPSMIDLPRTWMSPISECKCPVFEVATERNDGGVASLPSSCSSVTSHLMTNNQVRCDKVSACTQGKGTPRRDMQEGMNQEPGGGGSGQMNQNESLPPGPNNSDDAQSGIHWTAGVAFWTLGVFLLAGLFGEHSHNDTCMCPCAWQHLT